MAAHPTADPHAVDAAHGADAAHAAAGGEHAVSFPPFDTSLFASQLIWFAITFVALYFVVSRMIVPKVASVLEKRAGVLASDLNAAAAKSAAAEDARATMEKATAKARTEARAMVDSARAEVQTKLAAEQEAADKRLADKIAAAEASVEAVRGRALAEVPGIADQLARDIADKIAPVGAR